MSSWLGALVVMACLLHAHTSWAESKPVSRDDHAPAPSLEQAREAFVRGMELLEQGSFEAAEEQFMFAARGRQTPGLLFYIAHCRELQGRLVEALDTYRTAADLLVVSPASDVEQLVPAAIARIEAQLTLVQLAPPLSAEARLWVDGRAVEGNASFLVEPGQHELIIVEPNVSARVQTFVAEPGAKMELTVAPAAGAEERSEQPPPTFEVDDRGSPGLSGKKVALWSSVGVAVAGLGAGVVGTLMHVRARSSFEDWSATVEEAGSGSSLCLSATGELASSCDELESAQSRVRSSRALMIAGYSVAAVGALSSVLVASLWKDSPARVGLNVGPSVVSLKVAGHF